MLTSANFEDRQSFAIRLTVLRVAAIIVVAAIGVGFWIVQVVGHQRYEQLAERQHLRLLREVLRALLEGVPAHLSVDRIGQALAAVSGVSSVHDLHIWTLSSNRVALSAHLVVETLASWSEVLAAAQHVLAHEGIAHATLQPELATQTVRWLPRAADGAEAATAQLKEARQV